MTGNEVLVVWRRGCGDQWKELMKRFQVGRTTLTDRWNTAIAKITVGLKLEGEQKNGS